MAKKLAATSDSVRYDVLVVDQYKGSDGEEKNNWMRIGVAFPHSDGKGFSINAKAWPVGSHLVIRLHESQN